MSLNADDVAGAYGCVPLNDLPRFLAAIRSNTPEHRLAAFDAQADNIARIWVAPDVAAEWDLFRSESEKPLGTNERNK